MTNSQTKEVFKFRLIGTYSYYFSLIMCIIKSFRWSLKKVLYLGYRRLSLDCELLSRCIQLRLVYQLKI